MSPESGSQAEYTVSMSAATRELLLRLHEQAHGDGRVAEFVNALARINERLRASPTDFGEELFDLHAMNLTVKLAVVLPIVVEFGVYSDRRVVFIRSFRYVSRGQ